ncbi:hypothetical protein [Demequina lutea]|uniref:hypothetical protein n=1 Tax=Demequina lutea TaxID=431489 RepID=UPI000784E3B1|nr:hypothetical protein [Demequina lutea]
MVHHQIADLRSFRADAETEISMRKSIEATEDFGMGRATCGQRGIQIENAPQPVEQLAILKRRRLA